jgi:hypothetical protein
VKRTSTRAIFAGTAAALAAALLSGPLGAGAGAQPEANPQSNGFAITILDDLAAQRSEGNTSVTIGSDGRALISYYDAGNLDLKVAHCRNVICRAATTTVVDSEGDVGKWSAIAVGADVLGLISYYDATSGGLKVAHCQDATCSNATTATIDSEGGPPSIAIGTDGLGLVAYVAGGTVKVAHCATRTCSTATVTVIDVIQGVEAHASVAIGADGLALVSYIDRTEDGDFGLSVAHCTDVTCSTATTATPVSGFFERTASTAIAGDGLGLISVVDIDSNLYVVHCSNLACTDTTLA